MTVSKLAGYLVSAVLLFFGVIYALAASYNTTRIVVSIILFVAGFSVLYFTWRRQPSELVQRIEVPGKIRAQEIRCPNCSASIDMDHIKVVEGTPLAECTYCGNVFELTEEPKW